MTSSLWSTGLEAKLQEHLSSVNTTQKSNRENIQKIAAVEDTVQQQHQLYNRKVDQVQKLLEEIKANLEQAKKDLRSAVRVHNVTVQPAEELYTLKTLSLHPEQRPLGSDENLWSSGPLMKTFNLCSSARPQNVPSGDAPQDPGFSALLQKAVVLANR